MIELVAVVSMIIDHVGFVFFPEMIIFQIIGRLSFPLYAYLIALGYSRTKNSIIYFFRVLVLAIVSQWFFNYLISPIKLNVCFTLSFSIKWFFNYLISPIKLNVCFTLSFSIISLIVFESNRINKVLKLFLYILILFLALLLGCEYGSYGILLVLLFHLYIRNQHDKTYKIYAITSIILLIIVSMFVFSFSIIHLYSILSLPIILLTPKNIQKIKVNSIKHINYLVYPLHLLIMFLIRFAIVN